MRLASPRVIPVGGDTRGLPLVVRVGARFVGVLVADVAAGADGRVERTRPR